MKNLIQSLRDNWNILVQSKHAEHVHNYQSPDNKNPVGNQTSHWPFSLQHPNGNKSPGPSYIRNRCYYIGGSWHEIVPAQHSCSKQSRTLDVSCPSVKQELKWWISKGWFKSGRSLLQNQVEVPKKGHPMEIHLPTWTEDFQTSSYSFSPLAMSPRSSGPEE